MIHPAYADHPGKKTLTGLSGLFSFERQSGIDMPRLVDALRHIRFGVSWGGLETLIVPARGSADPRSENHFREVRSQSAHDPVRGRARWARRPLGGYRGSAARGATLETAQPWLVSLDKR